MKKSQKNVGLVFHLAAVWNLSAGSAGNSGNFSQKIKFPALFCLNRKLTSGNFFWQKKSVTVSTGTSGKIFKLAESSNFTWQLFKHQ